MARLDEQGRLKTTLPERATHAAVIIPVHNRRETTLRCLDSLRTDGVFEWARIIVVDDGSTDGTAAAIRASFEPVVVLRGSGNLWWTGAIRRGMERLDHDSLQCFFWLNDDCLPAPGTMRRLCNRTAEAGNIIHAAQCLDPETGEPSYGGGRLCGAKLVPRHCEASETLSCEWLPGNLVCFPASVIRKAGLPDHRAFPHYYGDAAYTLTARRHGYRLALAGDCRATCRLTRHDFSILLSDFTLGAFFKKYRQKESGYYWRAHLRLHQLAFGKAAGTGYYAANVLGRHAILLCCRLILPTRVKRWLKRSAARKRDAGMFRQQLPDCPLCGSRRLALHLNQPAWKILSCGECTNALTWPPPGIVDYASKDFHADTLKKELASYEDLPDSWRTAMDKQLRMLRRALAKGARILEVGCGHGILLERLARAGFCVSGLEASVSAAQLARRRGLDVSPGEFPSDCPPGPYDAIVLSHVFEHLKNLGDVCKQIERLAPGGQVLFVQANWRGLVPRVYLHKWCAWMPNEHYWHFTPKGLRFILERRGWPTLAHEHSTLAHDPKNALAKLACRFPILGDQFHLLARVPARSPADLDSTAQGKSPRSVHLPGKLR